MAHLYKRGSKFWISYYLSGKLVQKSLKTKNERMALSKKKRIEYELALGDLHVASKTPLPAPRSSAEALIAAWRHRTRSACGMPAPSSRRVWSNRR